jgi:hypothetical protein
MPNTKEELVSLFLQKRIGELVASYEIQIASLKADLAQVMNINQAATTPLKSEEK